MMKKNVLRSLCVASAAILALGCTTAFASQEEPIQKRVYYDAVPVTLTLTAGTTSLEKAYSAITTNRPSYSTITSLKIVTQSDTSINLSNLESEDVLFLKKLTALQKVDFSGATMYGNVYNIPEGIFTGLETLEEVVLNDYTFEIGNKAFAGCTNLHTINLDKVRTIGEGAFADCISLTAANTPALTWLGASAFEGCTSLESVNLANVQVVQASAFNNCISLKTVGNTTILNEVKDKAFAGCKQLAEIDLSKVNAAIGTMAFYDCTSLAATGNMNLIPAIGRYAFYNCAKIKSADLASTATIGDYAFYGCAALEEVKTGVSLRTISAGSFENCTALKSIDISRITHIYNAAFRNCKALNALSFTDVRYIGLNAFYGCSAMDKATVWPTQSAAIANNAFKYCAFDFSAGYPANTPLNEHNAPAQRPPLVFALVSTSGSADYKIGETIKLDELYTIKTASGADYAKLIQDKPAWMGSTADDIKVTTKIMQDGKDVESIDTSKEGTYEVTFTLAGAIGSNTNELALKLTIANTGGRWVEEDGKWYFYEGNTKLTGWLQYQNTWYYLHATTGEMQLGWVQVGGKWYYLENDGKMKTGWLQDGGVNYYLKPNGDMAVGWQQLDGTWYYFKSSGAMQTKWLQLGSTWYYLGTDGKMVTGTHTIDGKKYTFSSSGAMQ